MPVSPGRCNPGRMGAQTVELLKITDKLFLVPAENGGKFPFSQSVYVDAERKILFDAGVGPRVLGAFLKQFKVDIVIISHTHPDHTAGCGALGDLAAIFVPREGADTFGNLDLLADRFMEGDDEKELWKAMVEKVMGFSGSAATRTYDPQVAFDLGDVRLTALHTPGHTRDHYCFFEDQAGCMLLFDIDLSPYGPWYGNAESSIDDFEASINYVRSYNPEIAVSSHMGVLRKNVDGALEKFLGRIAQRDEMIFNALDTPRSLEELAGAFPFTRNYIPKLKSVFLYWETQMVRKHLNRLIERGDAVPQGGKYRKT